MDIIVLTTIVATFFVVIAIAEPLAARLALPFTVILASLGILLGAGAAFFLRTELTDALEPASLAILNLPIRSNVFLYVFLPTLLFQATLGLNIRRMADDAVPILVLAIVAVFLSTFVVGYALHWLSALPLAVCLLVGAIVSTTDPSAVVSIFRSISAPRRLARIVEGESLLNDAAAIALFGVFMAFVMVGVPNPSLTEAIARFPLLLVGGALTGWFVARAGLWFMTLVDRHELAVISVSIAMPYLAFVVAEQTLGASGVIAVVAAGITLNLIGPGRLPPGAWAALRDVWDVLAHWAGALVFIFAALLIPRLLDEVRAADLGLVFVVTVAAFAARAVVLYGFFPLLTRLRLSPQVETSYRSALLWGGLRGAVTLALALAVTESLRVPSETKRIVGILATGFALFTLVVQGSTLRLVISWLGLDRLTPIDEALSKQVVAVALQSVREDVARAAESYDLDRDIVRSEAKRFAERLDAAVTAAEGATEILDRDRITLGLIALAGAEQDLILERFRQSAISAKLSEQVLTDAARLIEAARAEGRTGYNRAARRSIGYGPGYRFAVFLDTRLRITAPLARLTVDRFESLLLQRLVLRDLHDFIDRRINWIHGRRVAELLHDLLDRRRDLVEQALEGLRLQYPGYAEELERRFIRASALRLEEREYDILREEGLIGEELHTQLRDGTRKARAGLATRPKLDLALKRSELTRQFPLFADLDDKTRKRLGRALRTRYVAAGEVIVRRDRPPGAVFFIASGAVELRIAGQTTRLGRGEMFGQLAVLAGRTLRTEVRAISASTLLILDEVRFRRLVTRSVALRAAVRDSGRKRGISEDALDRMLSTGA